MLQNRAVPGKKDSWKREDVVEQILDRTDL